VEVMRGMVEDVRPEMIIPLGGALVPYVVDPKDLERQVGVPVMNTKTVAIRFAETCHAIGLTQSPIAYPKVNLSYEDFQSMAYSG
jgi:hypothetical protein